MTISLVKCQIGSYTFVNNPKVEDIGNELLQTTARAIDGTMVSSYIPKTGDTTKIKRKRKFSLSGIDPDIDQIEAIEAELEVAGPIHFRDTLGTTYTVHVTGPLSQKISSDTYTTREYSFEVEEA